MNYQEIKDLIQEVGKAKLTHFEYKEGNVHIAMGCGQTPAAAVQGLSPVPTAVTAASTSLASAPAQPAMTETPEPIEEEKEENVQKAEEKEGELIKSPLVGTFYASPSEGADPYVQVGDHIKKGQVVGIVEAMKLMNEIESDYDGIVEEILVSNEENVEYGQPMFRIKVQGA